MSLRPVASDPCWQMTHEVDDPEQGVAHFPTRDAALAALWRARSEAHHDCEDPEEYRHLLTSEVVQGDQVCVRLVCDGCGRASHWEDGAVPLLRGTHYAPTEADQPDVLRDVEWSTDAQDQHHCPDCPTLLDPAEYDHYVDPTPLRVTK